MRYGYFLLRLTLITILPNASMLSVYGQTAAEQAQKWAREAKDQQVKAVAAAAKLDCEKPKAADKKALVDAVKKAVDAAKNARAQADIVKKAAEDASKTLDRNPKNKQAQKAKEEADKIAKDAEAAADEAAAAARAALDKAPGVAAADAIAKELDGKDISDNSKKKDAVNRLKKAAQAAADTNPCDPEEVKRVVRVELEKIKKEVSGNGEVRPWVDSLGKDLKDDKLISMPATGNDALVFTAKGTGRTTGHIADLSVFNPTGVAATVDLGACFIPSDGQYQPYVVPYIPVVTMAPYTSANIQLHGYCADIFTAPVPAGTSFPQVHTWVKAADLTPLGIDWQPSISNGWQLAVPAGSAIPTIPGTSTPLGHTIDFGTHPEEAATVLFDALQRIAQTYDQMHSKGAITTPFSGNPEKERESVIQQTFWKYAAELSGQEYKRADFQKNTVHQYEAATGQDFKSIPQDQQKQIEQGVEDFWSTFSAVGAEAKVLKVQVRR